MCKRIFKHETTEKKKGNIPFYKIGTFGKTADSFISKELYEEYKNNFPFPNIGDTLISASGSIGRTIKYSGEDAYYQDSNIVWIDHNKSFNPSFFFHLVSNIAWNGVEGSTIKRLYNDNILKTKVVFPNKFEQEKLGQIFNVLDKTFTLHQRNLFFPVKIFNISHIL